MHVYTCINTYYICFRNMVHTDTSNFNPSQEGSFCLPTFHIMVLLPQEEPWLPRTIYLQLTPEQHGEVRGANPRHIVENPHVTSQLSLYICSLTSTDSTNLRLHSTVVFILKISVYKWIPAVQTCVVLATCTPLFNPIIHTKFFQNCFSLTIQKTSPLKRVQDLCAIPHYPMFPPKTEVLISNLNQSFLSFSLSSVMLFI